MQRSSDAGWLERAIAAGDLEACRAELRGGGIAADERASFYSRLGEAFYYRQQYTEAAECAHAAFELAPHSPAIADFCAWCFSNCGHHRAAAEAYERLLDDRPGWAAGHRHASGSFAIAGDLDRAIQHAARASELEPNSAEFAVHTGCLLAGAGLHRDAVGYFARAAAVAPGDTAVLRHYSGSAFALGERESALALARRACEMAPGERSHAHHATELLLRCDRFDEAAALISARLAGDPEDAVGYRLLSAAEMLRGRIDEALGAIERALALASVQAEYHQHRGNLLYRLARFDEAAAAFDRAAALEPDNPAPKRSQLTVYFDSGRFRDALAIGGELIRLAPDNEEYAQAVLQILNRRFETLDGDYVVLSEHPAVPARRAREEPGFAAAALTQWRVIHALIIRETRTRFGDSTLGYGWALLEPILHILMLCLVFAVLMHGRPPTASAVPDCSC